MPQQVLAEDLAPFQFGGPLAGPNAQLLGLEGVDDAQGQRGLGPDDRQADVILLANLMSRGISVGLMSTFSATRAVPALPGATKMHLPEGFAPASRPARVHDRHCRQSEYSWADLLLRPMSTRGERPSHGPRAWLGGKKPDTVAILPHRLPAIVTSRARPPMPWPGPCRMAMFNKLLAQGSFRESTACPGDRLLFTATGADTQGANAGKDLQIRLQRQTIDRKLTLRRDAVDQACLMYQRSIKARCCPTSPGGVHATAQPLHRQRQGIRRPSR